MSDEQKWNERYLNQDTPWETGIHHPEMERLFTHYVTRGQTVLEIGCGTGINAQWLNQSGYKVTAIDISAEAIKKAKNNNPSIHFFEYGFFAKFSKFTSFFRYF